MKEVVEKPAETPAANRKKRILVVEDESTSRMFLLNQLKKASIEVETAANGGIALKKLKDGNFDAMVLDLVLLGMKGQDLVKQIRKTEAWANLLIFVCISAQRPDPWRGRAVRNGVTKLFDKGSSTVEEVVGEIVAHLAKPREVAALTAAKAPDSPQPKPAPTRQETEISPLVPETVFAPVAKAAAAQAKASPVASKPPEEGSQPLFTPLPTGRDAATAPKPAPPANPQPPAANEAVLRAHRDGKTGFFHNPDPAPPRSTNTSLLRKAAKAGQAAVATAVPAITGDTPLSFPPASDTTTISKPPPPPQPVVAESPEPPKERAGLAERIIAPFKIFGSRSDNSSDTGKRLQELQEQLAEVTKNRDELLSLLRDHPIFGATAGPVGKSEGLDEAKAAATRAEAAYQAELARSRQFEEELKRIREARDELNRKLAEEEKAAAESRRRSKELEERLVQSASELDEVKSELQKNIAAHSRVEGELRQQLNSSRESADIAKVAYQEEAARAERSTEELVALQQAREDLNSRLTAESQAAAESKRRGEERERQMREKEAEVERLKTELRQHTADAALKEKLSAAEAAAQTAQAACKEEAARGAQFEQELTRLKQAREDLNTKLAREEQAAAEARRRSEEMERQLATRTEELERVKSELERYAEGRKSLEAQLQREVAAANAAAEQARQDFQQETTLFHRSKEEVEALRQARDDLNAKFESEQHAAAESRKHSEELEGKLQASARELAHLRSELEKHVNERAALVTTSSRQLNAAKAAATKAEKAYQEQLKRSAKFEKELATLRQNRAQLLKTEQKSTAKSKRKAKELAEQAAKTAADLNSARQELEKLQAERERLESEHRQASQEVRGPAAADAAQTESRFRESISALARATSQLEKERGERRRIDQRAAFLSGQLENLHEELRKHLEVEKESQQRIAEFEQQSREREDALAKAVSDLQKEAAARQLVEAELKAKGEMGNQLREQFNLLDEAKRVFNAAQNKLEARLQTALTSLKQTQIKLQKQAGEKKRLETSLEDVQRKLHEQAQQSASELARLQASLQVEVIERRKLESHSLQSRYASVDASRLGRAFVNSFRTHLRPSAEHLLQVSRRLLELPLEGEHKEVIEAILEDALVLQTSMQDDARLPGEAEPPEAAKAA